MGPAMTLTELLPAIGDPDTLFDAFTAWVEGRGLALSPAQEEALIEVVSGSNVIVSTPTGSGKTLIATGAHFVALSARRAPTARDGRPTRSFYTAPVKALVSEKFFDLCATFGTDNVGMMTGDASVNAGAPIICCTAEVLANMALRDGAGAGGAQVGMDGVHFYAHPGRGWAWRVPILGLPGPQFVLMWATLGDVTRLEVDLTRRTGRPTAVVSSGARPVPLSYSYRLTPLQETIEDLLESGQAPVYVVHFTQAAAVERAQSLMSINVCSRGEKDRIGELIGGGPLAARVGPAPSPPARRG